MYLVNNNALAYIVLIILVLVSSQQARGQEVDVCRLNNQCSNVSGGYIDRAQMQGTLTLDDVTLNGIRPPYNSADPSFAPIIISLGTKNLNFSNLGLNAKHLTIDTVSPYNNHARAIAAGSNLNNETIAINLEESSIKLVNNNSIGKNTIGILFESDTTGQIYNLNLKNTTMDISSVSNNNTVGAIWTYSGNGFKETNIQLENSDLIATSASGSAYGIRTENKNNPSISSILIQSDANSTIKAKGYIAAYGIGVDTEAENATVYNQADITATTTASSSNAYGINLNANTNTIKSSGSINAIGGNAYGVSISGILDQEIYNTAAITAKSIDTTNGIATGILANNTNTSGGVFIYSSGDIKAEGYNSTGIQAISSGDSTIQVTGKIEAIGSIGKAVVSNSYTGDSNIYLLNGASLKGGTGIGSAGVIATSISGNQYLTFNQGSKIESLNDLAISSSNNSGITSVNNGGEVIGYSTLTGKNVEFNNLATGVLNLKFFNQGQKQDIIYNIGTGDSSSFNNEGIIKFADENFNNQPTQTNAVFNVAAFTNAGIIDLTRKNPTGSNTLVGDTFTINGNYQSQGGSIFLNTLIDDAQSNSGLGISDLLIVNGNVSTGNNGATKLYITPTVNSTLGAVTTGDGIKVVDINGTSSNDAFVLGRPLTYGAYEYTLNQGTANSNWYLSNNSLDEITYNSAMASYLANQTAAIQMFQQSLFDRLIASSESMNDASKPLFWLKTNVAHTNYDTFHANFSNRTRTYTAQIGGDIGLWTLENGGYFHLGLMAGYGNAKSTNRSRQTATKIDGDVKGYSAGVYGTYFANQDTNLGLYMDLWSQMSWYRNKVSGKSQVSTQKYDSNLWSNAIEVGYGINLAKSGDYQWMVTPQIQLTYNYYNADNIHDKNQLHVSNNDASGLDTRVGFRFHARGTERSLLEPFLEMNWLNSTAKNAIDFNDRTIKDGFAKNRLEAKIGLQGNINQRLSSSVQFGGQWGDSSSYKSYKGQLNINYKF